MRSTALEVCTEALPPPQECHCWWEPAQMPTSILEQGARLVSHVQKPESITQYYALQLQNIKIMCNTKCTDLEVMKSMGYPSKETLPHWKP